jgi:hypothetical protein
MESLLLQIEQTGLATWIHESGSLYGYPLILFLHTLGLSTLVGLNAVIDLRLLGFGPSIPLRSFERTFKLMWAGFALNAATGSLLFIAAASKNAANPAFYVKLVFVVAGLVTLTMIQTKIFRDSRLDQQPVQLAGKVLGAASLACWFIVLGSGRMIAYVAEFL